MQLLGVEFVGYARFERQFIPLLPGITLLAGHNNAGKTALLRGLTTLNSLIFEVEQRGTADDRAILFAVQKSPFPKFKLDFIVRVDPVELKRVVRLSDRGGAENAFREGVLLRLSFSTCGPTLDFEEAVLFHPISDLSPGKKTFTLANVTDAPPVQALVVSEVFWPDLDVKNRISLPHSGTYVNSSGSHPHLQAGFLFSELLQVMNCKLIEAHRVTTNAQPVNSATGLTTSGSTLPAFLHKLQVNDRDKFREIELFVTEVFPEFRGLHTPLESQNTIISLEDRETRQKIPLERCGTGVEQMLVLSTFVLTSSPGTVLLLDEPHSYLHPVAERQLLRFIRSHSEHRYIISTHSAVLINGVEPDRIVYIAPPGVSYSTDQDKPEVASILFDLGTVTQMPSSTHD